MVTLSGAAAGAWIRRSSNSRNRGDANRSGIVLGTTNHNQQRELSGKYELKREQSEQHQPGRSNRNIRKHEFGRQQLGEPEYPKFQFQQRRRKQRISYRSKQRRR